MSLVSRSSKCLPCSDSLIIGDNFVLKCYHVLDVKFSKAVTLLCKIQHLEAKAAFPEMVIEELRVQTKIIEC